MATQILVVDDDPIMHQLLEHHFERAGYKTLSAKNGREAIDIAAKELPGLIVMDIMMANMDGLTALREMKKTPATQNIPVIVITANNHYVSRQEAEASGAVLLLTKPFSPTQLMVEIKRLIPQ
jgi:CheY-like chemotaxis protein